MEVREGPASLVPVALEGVHVVQQLSMLTMGSG